MFVLLSLYTGIFYPSRFGGAESNILCLILWGGAFNTCAPVTSRFAPPFNYWGVLGRFIICFCCGAFYKVNPRAFLYSLMQEASYVLFGCLPEKHHVQHRREVRALCSRRSLAPSLLFQDPGNTACPVGS